MKVKNKLKNVDDYTFGFYAQDINEPFDTPPAFRRGECQGRRN